MESHLDIEGYVTCRSQWCDHLVVEEVARRSGGFCSECFAAGIGKRTKRIEVQNQGDRAMYRAHPPKPGTTGTPGRLHSIQKAKRRALKRLRNIFPEVYDILLAEERVREGLDPWPLESVLYTDHDPEAAEATLAFADVYHQLTKHGVDVDGPSQVQAPHED